MSPQQWAFYIGGLESKRANLCIRYHHCSREEVHMHTIITQQIAREIAMLIYKDIKPYVNAHQTEYQQFLADIQQSEGGESNGNSKKNV